MRPVVVEKALILNMVDGAEPFVGSVRFEDGRITHIGGDVPSAQTRVDATGGVLIPAFVQTHLHLCQSLFRNLADDLSLLDWLKLRIWPMEAALKPADMRASADLGLLELLRGGTTTILDMGSVHHTNEVAAAVQRSKTRAFVGKAMMDRGDDVPAGLREDTAFSIKESQALQKCWHGAANGRIRYAYAPRFAPSCTTELLKTVGDICRDDGLVVHTHCAESVDEIALIRNEFGRSNVEYLEDCGLVGPKSVFAHMIHLDEKDTAVVKATKTNITHCPASNCKLGSGIAPIPAYLAAGINVAIGADGAPCNNTLDAFTEMRLAALIHKPRFGPTAMDARTVLKLATVAGAKALDLTDELGTIEVGKRADLVHLRLDKPYNGVAGDPFAKIVYTGCRENVVDVWCEGERIVQDGELLTMDQEEVLARGRESAKSLLTRL